MVTNATPEHRSPASQLFSECLVYSCRVDVKPDIWRNVKQRYTTSNGRRASGFAFLSFMEHCNAPLPTPHSTSEYLRASVLSKIAAWLYSDKQARNIMLRRAPSYSSGPKALICFQINFSMQKPSRTFEEPVSFTEQSSTDDCQSHRITAELYRWPLSSG